MFFAFLTLAIGLSISATAAYFSITGLAELFAASFWGVIIMGVAIEAGKVVSAAWLHRNWKNPLVSKLHKAYLLIAILIAMSITSLGIFSYLSAAHLNQEKPVITQITEQTAIESQIDSLQKELQDLQKNLDDVNSLSKTKKDWSLDYQRIHIIKQMEADRNQINDLNKKLMKLKETTSSVTLQLGPAQYLGQLLYGTGSASADKAVEVFIVLIMTVFDPLAIMLILSSNITFQEIRKEKKLIKSENIEESKEKTEIKSATNTASPAKLETPKTRDWWR